MERGNLPQTVPLTCHLSMKEPGFQSPNLFVHCFQPEASVGTHSETWQWAVLHQVPSVVSVPRAWELSLPHKTIMSLCARHFVTFLWSSVALRKHNYWLTILRNTNYCPPPVRLMGLGDVHPMGSWGKRSLVASWILNCFSWRGPAIEALPDRLLQSDLTL